jgi:hypothetical protein
MVSGNKSTQISVFPPHILPLGESGDAGRPTLRVPVAYIQCHTVHYIATKLPDPDPAFAKVPVGLAAVHGELGMTAMSPDGCGVHKFLR